MRDRPSHRLYLLTGNVPEHVQQVLSKQLHLMEGFPWVNVLTDQAYDVMMGSLLRAQFIPIGPHMNEGRLRLQWIGRDTPSKPMPAWEFPWANGLDTLSQERLREILTWAGTQTARYDSSSHWYSRCREESITFPILNGKDITIPVREVLYLQAERDMSRVCYGHGGETSEKTVDRSIGKCAELLEAFGFMRIHRGYVVNLGCVNRCEERDKTRMVVLCNQTILPVARRRCPELLARLKEVDAEPYRSSDSPTDATIT